MATTIKAVRLGAFEYFPKPIDVDELEGAIKRALDLSKARRSSTPIASVPAREFQKGEIIGKTKEMNEIFKTIGVLSANRVNVLIEGETGTGKELVARAIHYHGTYKDQPFVAINCSAIVENLLESELFGHEKGAFTGAISSKKGMFEIAEYGTVFLDEVAEMPFELQAKLLRVLQEKEFQRVGGNKALQLKARVIAATNRNLASMVREGKFRDDLYYRLSVATIHIPPLRDRRTDIPLIVQYLLKKINTELHNRIDRVDNAAMERLMDYRWPGNIRELENVLTKAAILTKGDIILYPALAPLLLTGNAATGKGQGERDPKEELFETERDRIIRILNDVRWHYGHACKALGISRPTLNKKMKDYRIEPK
jgi:two-component system response regulator AtoC